MRISNGTCSVWSPQTVEIERDCLEEKKTFLNIFIKLKENILNGKYTTEKGMSMLYSYSRPSLFTSLFFFRQLLHNNVKFLLNRESCIIVTSFQKLMFNLTL